MTRRIECQSVETTRPGVTLEVSVKYDMANSDFMGHGTGRSRGYYVVVTYIETRDGMKYAICGRGGQGLLEPAARFNARRLQQLADVAGPENVALTAIVNRVLERNGLQRINSELAEPVCA